MKEKPIERDFPIEKINEIAEREAHAKEKYKPILFIHKWWARRLGSVFRSIVLYTLADENTKVIDEFTGKWREITKEELKNPWLLYLKDVDFGGKIVLDPMMGGGTTVVEALRTGCKVVAQDLNPVAWFLVKKIVETVDINELDKAFKNLENKVAEEIKQYYKTVCPDCLNDYTETQGRTKEDVIEGLIEKLKILNEPREVYEQYWFEDKAKIHGKKQIFADAMYYFWIKVLPCLACGTEVPLFRGYMLAKSRESDGHHVICPNCYNIFIVENYKLNTKCPKCKEEYNPNNDGNVEGKYYICTNADCGQKNVMIESILRTGKPKEKLYAVEYYCRCCGKKDYKEIDGFDISLYKKATEEYNRLERDTLNKYIPSTKIPNGVKTREMLNYGYKYWRDMFNNRQLLNLGKLHRKILELDIDENIKELILIRFSAFLEYQNMLCEYHRNKNHIYNLFKMHAFHATPNPVENNVWGTDYGLGIYKTQIKALINCKQYNLRPFEKYILNGKSFEKTSKMQVIGKLGEIFFDKNSNISISCGDSSYLNIPDKTIDAVITDPPYYGNVMYSELSEFYYAWLRIYLKKKYEYFRGEHVPNATEIIVNQVQDKNDKDFIDGLTAVFKESGKKLKDTGCMAFTFHHQEEKAWGAVLRSVLNAGFYVSAIYPVQSEKSTSLHIFQKANVRYDMVVVCKKRINSSEKKHWSQLEDEIYFKVQNEIERLEQYKKTLSQEDIFVITIGKCLELYSKFYPEVYKGDMKLSIDEALSSIRDIVDSQLMHTRFNQVALETDTITAIYLFYLVNKPNISFDSLNKSLKMRSIAMKEILESGLVEKAGTSLLVLTPQEKAKHIESRRQENLSSIDRAHHLYHLWKKGTIGSFENTLSDDEKDFWAEDSVFKTLEYLSQAEKHIIYQDIIKFLKRWQHRKLF